MRNLKVSTHLSYYDDSFAYKENFVSLGDNILLYTDYGNLSDKYDVRQDCIIKDSRENRVRLKRYLTKQGYCRVSDLKECSIYELIDDMGYCGVDYSNIDELCDTLLEIGISSESGYMRVRSNGYSQGDVVTILVNVKEFRKSTGVGFNINSHQKWFDHWLWDMPISGEIAVSFEYTSKGGVTSMISASFDFIEVTEDEYNVREINIKQIIKGVLYECPYELPQSDIELIKKELNKIDYTDVKYPCYC